MFDKKSKAYGGELLKTRKGRAGPRPLTTRDTMHLVLRSAKAEGEWSFKRHHRRILEISEKFSRKYGVKVLSLANVGNHLHLHMKLSRRQGYKPFIRAVSSAIAMAVTGASRWRPLKQGRFWDYRPFTRVIQGFNAFLQLKDYMRINQLEGMGWAKQTARLIIKNSLRTQNTS